MSVRVGVKAEAGALMTFPPPRQKQWEACGSGTQKDMEIFSLSAKPLEPQPMLPQPVPMGLLGNIINRPVPERASQLQLFSLHRFQVSATSSGVRQPKSCILRDLEDPTHCLLAGQGKPLHATYTSMGQEGMSQSISK